MEKIDRIKKELKALLSSEGGIYKVMETVVQLLPESSPKYPALKALKADITILNQQKDSKSSSKLVETKLLDFILKLKDSDLGELGDSTLTLVGPSSEKPPSITRKEHRYKAIITTFFGVFVALGLFLFVFFAFSMKFHCDQEWMKAMNQNHCAAFQKFVELSPRCPQVMEAEQAIKERCLD